MKISFGKLKVVALIILTTSTGFSQAAKSPGAEGGATQKDLTLERALLAGELQSLEKETRGFSNPLAEALAKAEIADAAWQLDQTWSKNLLRAAYRLALPKSDEGGLQNRPAGSKPMLFGAADRSRLKIRNRVLEIARRDKELVGELIEMGADSLGAYGKHFASAVLADQVIEEGDVNAAGAYILQGIEADPTQGAAPDIINRVAVRDRALADRLVLRYIGELRRFPISPVNQSDIRAFGILSGLVRPYLFDPTVHREPVKVQPPGPEVMRAYVTYALEALGTLEQQHPGYLIRRRPTLLSLWVPLQQYAPELSGTFQNLEGRSRRPGVNSPLPTAASVEEERRSRHEKRMRDALDGEQPDESAIYAAVGKKDFDKARRLVGKLSDIPKKKQLADFVNAEEAATLSAKGEIYAAEAPAKELERAASISRVYPLLIRKAVAAKDLLFANKLVFQALRQVKNSDTSPPLAPDGVPAAAVASDPNFDPVLSAIANLAIEIFPSSHELAFVILDELVAAANTGARETEHAPFSFEIGVFKKLAPEGETHARQAADSLRNPVQRVLALAAIYQWKVKGLANQQTRPGKLNSH